MIRSRKYSVIVFDLGNDHTPFDHSVLKIELDKVKPNS